MKIYDVPIQNGENEYIITAGGEKGFTAKCIIKIDTNQASIGTTETEKKWHVWNVLVEKMFNVTKNHLPINAWLEWCKKSKDERYAMVCAGEVVVKSKERVKGLDFNDLIDTTTVIRLVSSDS